MRNHDNRIIFFSAPSQGLRSLMWRSGQAPMSVHPPFWVGCPSTPCKHWAVRRIIACFVYSFCGIFPLRDRLFLLILLFIPSIFSSFFTTLHFTAVIPLYENHVKSTTTSLLNQSKIYVNGQQTHRSASAIQQFVFYILYKFYKFLIVFKARFPSAFFNLLFSSCNAAISFNNFSFCSSNNSIFLFCAIFPM